MTYRVVAWSTGNVGRHAIAGIDARPDLELVGVWVSNPDKVGKDAGDLAGLGRHARRDRHRRRRRPVRPAARLRRPHAMADHRLIEALADLERILRAGVNVVSSGPVFLQYPDGVVADSMIDRAPARRRRLPGSRCGSTASTPVSPTTGSPS